MLCLQKMLNIKSYKTVWIMGHKIRKAMADRDAMYQLGGLVEVDDAYFGGTRAGKRGRGAEGKSKVVVSVENRDDRAGFASMCIVDAVSKEEIAEKVKPCISEGSVVRTDGWRAYKVLNSDTIEHSPVVVGSGKNAINVLPWVHTLISNIKGNIRGVYHGVESKHMARYLPEFCYRFNRRFWETELFDRLLNACVNTTTITYSELKA